MGVTFQTGPKVPWRFERIIKRKNKLFIECSNDNITWTRLEVVETKNAIMYIRNYKKFKQGGKS